MAGTIDCAVSVKAEGLDTAVAAMEALASAAERANEALAKLGEHKHGGITVKVVGNLAHIDVRPAVEAA